MVESECVINDGEYIRDVARDENSEADYIECCDFEPRFLEDFIHVGNESASPTFAKNRLYFDPVVVKIELHLVIVNIRELEA